MNKGQHNTFKKVSPDFFGIEGFFCLVDLKTIFYDNEVQKEGDFLESN